MKTDIAKQPLPLIFITYAILLGIFTLRAVNAPSVMESDAAVGSSLGMLVDDLTGWNAGFQRAVSLTLIFINSLLVTSIITRYLVSVVRTFLPMILFITVSCGVFFTVNHPSAHLACTLLLASSDMMISSFKRSNRFQQIFKSMFYLGTATLLYPPAIMLLAAFLILMFLYKRSLREMFTGLLSYPLPLFICTTLWWISGYSFDHVACNFASELAMPADIDWSGMITFPDNVYSLALAAYMALLLLASVVVTFASLREMRTRARKINIHFVIMLFATLAMLLLPSCGIFITVFLGAESALIVHLLFVKSSHLVGTILYFVLLVLSVLANIGL